MGFIFGLMIGGALSSGGSAALPNLGTIPFRCLSAFEVSDADYRQCRQPSLNSDLYSTCLREDREKATGGCSVEQNIKWEIAGLHQIKSAMDVTVKEPFDLRTTLATMKSAKELGVRMSIWDRDIKAVEDAIATIEIFRNIKSVK